MNEIVIEKLPEFPKEFISEKEQIRQLFFYIDEINSSVDYIDKSIQIEQKSNLAISLILLNSFSNCKNDIATFNKETKTNTTIIIDDFIDYYSKLFTVIQQSFHNVEIKTLTNHLKQQNISLITKVEQISFKCEKLLKIREYYKTIESKRGKIFNELQEISKEAKEIRENDKKRYMYSLVEKNNNDFIEKVNEYDKYEDQKYQTHKEIKELENNINEEIKELFINVINAFSSNLKNFKTHFDIITNEYQTKINNIITTVIKPIIKELNTKIIKDNNIPYSFLNYDINLNKDNILSNDIINQMNQNATDALNKISYTKKVIYRLLNCLKETQRSLSENVRIFHKELNSINISNKFYYEKTTLIMQMTSYIRSLFELYYKKLQDKSNAINLLMINALEKYYKEISNEELLLSNSIIKFNKDILNIKNSNHNIFIEKENIENEYNSIKALVEKDPSYLSKYEKEFLVVKKDLDKINLKVADAYSKIQPILIEFNENIIKKYISYLNIYESNKVAELKANCIKVFSYEEQFFKQLSDHFLYKNQIQGSKDEINNYIIGKFINFSQNFNYIIKGSFYYSPKIEDISHLEMLKTRENLDLNSYVLKLQFNEDKIKKLRDDIKKFKEDNSYRKNVQLYKDIFPIDNDETVIDSYSAALKEGFLLQGKIYVTNKKLVFYSWFNKSTLFGKTIYIIPLNDISLVEKKENIIFNNMIEIRAKKAVFLFCSLPYRDNCYSSIKNQRFGKPIQEEICKDSLTKAKSINISHSKEIEEVNNGIDKKENKLIYNNICNSINNSYSKEVNVVIESQYDKWLNKLNLFTSQRKKEFNEKIKRDFICEFISNYSLGNISLPEIFNTIFNPNNNLEIFGNKSFALAYAEKKQDYNLDIKIIENIDTAPLYFLIGEDKHLREYDIDNPNRDIESLEYTIKCTHPILKKRFIGPSKLNIFDIYTIYFISPTCLIVELISSVTGFILMDSFKTIIRYTINTEISFTNNKFEYQTKMTIGLSILFIKDTWLKRIITSEAKDDNKILIMENLFPLIKEVVNFILKEKEKHGYSLVNNLLVFEKRERRRSKEKKSNQENEDKNKQEEKKVKKIENEIKLGGITKVAFHDFINYYINQKYIFRCFFLIFLAVIFSIFSKEFAIIVFINLYGFSLLYYKVELIQKQIENLRK